MVVDGAPLNTLIQALLRTDRTEMGFTYMDGAVCRETVFSVRSLVAYLDGDYDTIITYDGVLIDPDGDKSGVADSVVDRLRQRINGGAAA